MPADAHLCLIAKDGHVIAVRVLAQLGDDVDIDDRGPMDAHKSTLVEHFVQ